MFELTGIHDYDERKGRLNRPLEFQSGEVWRASMAIGVAFQKKLFCFPWLEPEFLVSDLGYFNNKVDQTIYLKKPKNRK